MSLIVSSSTLLGIHWSSEKHKQSHNTCGVAQLTLPLLCFLAFFVGLSDGCGDVNGFCFWGEEGGDWEQGEDGVDIPAATGEGTGTLLKVEQPRLSMAGIWVSNFSHFESLPSFLNFGGMNDK